MGPCEADGCTNGTKGRARYCSGRCRMRAHRTRVKLGEVLTEEQKRVQTLRREADRLEEQAKRYDAGALRRTVKAREHRALATKLRLEASGQGGLYESR